MRRRKRVLRSCLWTLFVNGPNDWSLWNCTWTFENDSWDTDVAPRLCYR